MIYLKEKQYSKTITSVPYQIIPLMQKILSDLEQKVQPAPKEELIKRGILGEVKSNSGNGVYAENLPGGISPAIREHEIAHSLLGFDGSPRGEYLADTWMLYKTGKIELFRGIGYRPPINLS